MRIYSLKKGGSRKLAQLMVMLQSELSTRIYSSVFDFLLNIKFVDKQ
jgi:hypothetical protein